MTIAPACGNASRLLGQDLQYHIAQESIEIPMLVTILIGPNGVLLFLPNFSK
jgi:hypothetical protein